ncbi:MAG: hypothetical protein Q9170_000054 [Blastenia crenularia]
MSFPVSALSAQPLSVQVKGLTQHQNPNLIPSPGLENRVPKTVTPSSSHQQRLGQGNDHLTILSNAFASASIALNGNSTSQIGLTWQPTIYHNLIPISKSQLTIASHKRDAAAAGLLQPGGDAKQPRIESPSTELAAPRKKVGRPRGTFTAHRKPVQARLALRINKPVQNRLPSDIWDQIIRQSPLAFVYRNRYAARDFREVLNKYSLWKAVRYNTYGPGHPDPPPGLNEFQYADLLVGIGCQTKGCKNKRASRVFWAFRRRWCQSCLRKKTVTLEECGSFLERYPDIDKCIPQLHGWKYTMWKEGDEHLPKSAILVLRSDLSRLAEDMDNIEAKFGTKHSDTHHEVKAWFGKKFEEIDNLVERTKTIESWAVPYAAEIRNEAASNRKARSDFFAAKAQTMEPPLVLADLAALPCFQSAIRSKIELSDKSWTSLQKKIEADHEQEGRRVAKLRSKQTHPKRVNKDIILKIARQVFLDMLNHYPGLLGPDEDVVRIYLTRVYKTLQPLTGRGTRVLAMDDAKLVYDEYILALVEKLEDEDRGKAVMQLRCAACACRQGNPPMQGTFIELMEHCWIEHGALLRFTDERPDADTFPWRQVEWPPNLPILPSRREALGSRFWMWGPVPDLCVALSVKGQGAFDGRVAAIHCGPPPAMFVENLFYVASQFGSSLTDEYKTQIGLEYAGQKFAESTGSRPNRAVFEELHMAILRQGISGLFDSFRCLACCENARFVGNVGYFARSVKPLAKLSEHFFSKHYRREWTREMFKLPTAQELLTHLHLPANQNARLTFCHLFPPEQGPALDPRLEGDMPKASHDNEEEIIRDSWGFPDPEDDAEERIPSGYADDEEEGSEEEGDSSEEQEDEEYNEDHQGIRSLQNLPKSTRYVVEMDEDGVRHAVATCESGFAIVEDVSRKEDGAEGVDGTEETGSLIAKDVSEEDDYEADEEVEDERKVVIARRPQGGRDMGRDKGMDDDMGDETDDDSDDHGANGAEAVEKKRYGMPRMLHGFGDDYDTPDFICNIAATKQRESNERSK